KIKSAVDRTPHHQKYIEEKLEDELKDHVLLLKQFFTGAGVYGAESKIMGFSGYLCELLILHYRSFENFVKEAEKWEPGKVIDIEKAYSTAEDARRMFDQDPLIVVDPVDPGRNAAAAVSTQNFSTVIQACRDFEKTPSIKFFFPTQPKLFLSHDLARAIRKRKTHVFCIYFRHPELVEDVIYPQLRKTEKAIVARLVQHGFEVFRSDVWADERSAAILLELPFLRLPVIQVRPGPVLPRDASSFIQEHRGSPRVLAGPFIDNAGRVVFEMERAEGDALRLLRRIVSEKIGFGKHVAASLERYQLLEDTKIASLFKNRGFTRFVSEFFQKQLPWYR
ncbi:MAG: CCA tRNA nucleotidyltransferase, partial [Candidatus Hadarchaeales archaeon]